MKQVQLKINPDIILNAKLQKVSQATGVSLARAITEALEAFLSGEGSNNPESKASRAGEKHIFCH